MKDRFDDIEEVEKFNPFHDSLGKFSNKMGFKTYSANPKTKAGQMAIARSDAAGHGYTINVHRESKGENIQQNQRWITTGKKPKVPAAQSAKLQQMAARGTRSKDKANGSGQSKPKPQPTPKPAAAPKTQPATQSAPKPATQQNTKTQTLEQSLAGVKLDTSAKLALQARNRFGNPVQTKKVAEDHDQARVAGKDISKTFDINKMKTKKNPIDAIAEAQGWNKEPTVTNDRDLFDKAAVRAGRVMVRSVHDDDRRHPDGSWKKVDTGEGVAKKTMTNGNYALGGSGATACGTGMYVVDCDIRRKGPSAMKKAVWYAQEHSFGYGNRQMMATVHPDAKIADQATARKLTRDFYNLSSREKARFGNDSNTYIASKGYDGAKWDDDRDPMAYTTVFNKSALIFYGGVADK